MRARVFEDWERQRIQAVVFLEGNMGRRYYDPAAFLWVDDTTPPTQQPTDVPMVLDLPDQVARVLFEALSEHFNGVRAPGDAFALRRDLDAERGRTDKLIDAVIGRLG